MMRAHMPKKCARFCHFAFLQSTRRIYASLTSAPVCNVWSCLSLLMYRCARRFSSSNTIGHRRSSTVRSPLLHACRSSVTAERDEAFMVCFFRQLNTPDTSDPPIPHSQMKGQFSKGATHEKY